MFGCVVLRGQYQAFPVPTEERWQDTRHVGISGRTGQIPGVRIRGIEERNTGGSGHHARIQESHTTGTVHV